MKILKHMKDGGPESTVDGWFLVEIKSLFSIVLLRFADGSRDNYRSHAFDSWNWVLKGLVREELCVDDETRRLDMLNEYERGRWYLPSWRPIRTLRNTFHRVRSFGTTWVFSLRGPWSKTWLEYDPKRDLFIQLGRGRVVIATGKLVAGAIDWVPKMMPWTKELP